MSGKWTELKSSGITSKTPDNIMLGAGTIHKNLAYTGYELLTEQPSDWATGFANYYKRTGTTPNFTYTALIATETWAANTFYEKCWNFDESLLGATSGGTKLTIRPEIKNIEVDGALVKVKGLTRKVGEIATMETNLIELTPDLIKMLVIGDNGESSIAGYDEIVSKHQFEDGDYIENFGYIGHKTTGEPIIIIFEYALCSSGMELEGKNKENAVIPVTFECYAEISPEADILPYHIYYPTPTT